MKLNPYKRIQAITIAELYPSIPGLCAFGCGKALTGRRTRWCSQKCCNNAGYQLALTQEIPDVIRKELRKRDKDIEGNLWCACGCGTNVTYEDWEADHIIPVYKGGGGLGLSNYQILAKNCHKGKTKKDLKNKTAIKNELRRN